MRYLLALAMLAGCAEPSTCYSDRECKGDRVCYFGTCVGAAAPPDMARDLAPRADLSFTRHTRCDCVMPEDCIGSFGGADMWGGFTHACDDGGVLCWSYFCGVDRLCRLERIERSPCDGGGNCVTEAVTLPDGGECVP